MPFLMLLVMKIAELYTYYLQSDGVFTDTRNPLEKGLFFALSGPHFNATAFANEALERGATAVVMEDATLAAKNNQFLLVPNVLKALQQLAQHHRQQLPTKIIGLTGSNGKTTTKELMASVLRTHFKTQATKGNLNNHIGVPLSLLALSPNTEVAVIEMGANHQGEIAALCEIALPDIGYITNFGKAHLEGFGGIEGIVKGKSELYRFIQKNKGMVLCNAADSKQMECTNSLTRFTFGNQEGTDCFLQYSASKPLEIVTPKGTIHSDLYGAYNLSNIGAAIALGYYMEIPFEKIKSGIAAYKATANRSQTLTVGSNEVVLDAYNANPTSMKIAIHSFLEEFQNDRVLILGDMLELGNYASAEHQAIVDALEMQDHCQVYLVGPNFSQTINNPERFKTYANTQSLIESLAVRNFSNKNIFIKGSRAFGLEKIVEKLENLNS